MKYEVKYMVVHQGGALVCSEFSFILSLTVCLFQRFLVIVLSHSANDLVIDAIIEHATFVSSANTLLTEPGENLGILEANANIHKR